MNAVFPKRALLLVVAGRAADSITTLYGLWAAGLYERNPIARHLFDQIGALPGLLVGNLVGLAMLVAGVELAAQSCRELSMTESRIRLLRIGCYVTYAGFSFVVAAHNLRLLVLVA